MMMEAKQEEGEAPLRHPSSVAAPRPRRPTPDHPPYAEMVRMALRELAEEGGSTEASISGYIQSNYTRLPPGHSRLLPYYLGKFVSAGDVSMLSPNRFALPPTPPSPTLPLPHHYPIPPPNHHPNPNPRQNAAGPQIPRRRGRPPKPAGPQIPRRRGRPPKRKKATTSGSAVGGLMLPPWPKNPHHVTDSSASPAPPRRGRGRPRKNPQTPSAPVPRPRLIIRLRSKPPSTSEVMSNRNLRDGLTSECDSGNVDGWEAAQRKPNDNALLANAHIIPPTVQSEPDVEMLHMDQMQPEPEGGLLLLRWPESEPMASAQLHIESLSSSTIHPKSDELFLPQEPWKEELLQLLPQPGPMQSELHEEPMLSISTQPEPEEQLVQSVPLRMELIEISSQLAPEQPESIEETLLQPELYDQEYFPPGQLLQEPKEEPLVLPSIQIDPKEELLSLASIEPEVKEESSPPAPIPAMEKGEKDGHSSKHRRTHAKHRRLWFEC